MSEIQPGEFCEEHFSWLCQAGQGKCEPALATPASSLACEQAQRGPRRACCPARRAGRRMSYDQCADCRHQWHGLPCQGIAYQNPLQPYAHTPCPCPSSYEESA